MANYAKFTDTITPESLGLTDDELKFIFVKNYIGSFVHDSLGVTFYLNGNGQKRLMQILKKQQKQEEKDRKKAEKEKGGE